MGNFDGDWRIRETGAGEVVSVLYSLCASIDSVVLDPLPVPFAGSNGFLSMRREAFMDFALEQERVAPLISVTPADLTWQNMRARPGTRNGREEGSNQRGPDSCPSSSTTRTAKLSSNA